MGFSSLSGHAKTSARTPRAFSVCYRCGRWWNRDRLRDQFDFRGGGLQNLYVLVCPPCYDRPNEQLRAIILPQDPAPVYRPSVEPFVDDET